MNQGNLWQGIATRLLHKQVKELTLENVALKLKLHQTMSSRQQLTPLEEKILTEMQVRPNFPGLLPIDSGYSTSLEEDVDYLAACRLSGMLTVPNAKLSQLTDGICKLLHDYEWPKVTIMTSLFREEDIENCLESHAKQIYPNCNSVIIAHSDGDLKEKIESAAAKKLKDCTVIGVSREHPVGRCYNEGVKHCDGKYIAKIDDDDFYGPWYVMDYIIAMEQMDAPVASKKSFFIWLEQSDETYLINSNRMTSFGPSGIGCSITLRRDFMDHIAFPETFDPIMDQVFYREVVAMGQEVLSIHPFGLVVRRRPNKDKHVWKANDKAFRKAHNLFVGTRKVLPLLLEEEDRPDVSDFKVGKGYRLLKMEGQVERKAPAAATLAVMNSLGLERVSQGLPLTYRKAEKSLIRRERMVSFLYRVYKRLPPWLQKPVRKNFLLQRLKRIYST